jgi:hypothetical protein
MTLLYVLLGLMVARQAPASARYYCSGDWINTVAVTGSCGWGIGGGGPGGLPGADDTVGDCVAGMGGSRRPAAVASVARLATSAPLALDE